MNGKLHQKHILSRSHSSYLTTVLEHVLLIGLGMLAIVLHARLRTPLNMPGHHGLEFMAVLLAGRMSSRLPAASSLSSAGIGLLLLFPVLGFSDPFMGFNYMLPGFFLDLVWNLSSERKHQLLLMIPAAGVAYLMIPLSRLMLSWITAYPYNSFLKHGPVAVLAGYGMFGLAGGVLGSGLSKLGKRLIKR